MGTLVIHRLPFYKYERLLITNTKSHQQLKMELGKRRRDADTTIQVAAATANREKATETPISRLSPAILRDHVFAFDFKTHETRIQAQTTPDVEQLEVVMGVMEREPDFSEGMRARKIPQPYFCRYQTLDDVELQIDWKSTLVGVLQLRRLDLSLTMTSQIGSILSAASSVCPQLTALLLPLEDVNRNERSSIFMDLYAALERSHKSNGGSPSTKDFRDSRKRTRHPLGCSDVVLSED